MHNIEIKKLIPDLVEDYLHFFDTTEHYGEKKMKCYCIMWCTDAAYNAGGSYWYEDPVQRRKAALKRVESGAIQGYLAYHQDKVIGWCNANDKTACHQCMEHLRNNEALPIERCIDGVKSKFVFCFAIAPEYMRQGIAAMLLRKVCEDAKHEGYAQVYAIPAKEFGDTGKSFMGPYSLYEKMGFHVIGENTDRYIVKKMLSS